MNDGRMTSAEAMTSSREKYYGRTDAEMKLRSDLSKCADALAQYEAEEAARRAMPELANPWMVITVDGRMYRAQDREEALALATRWEADDPEDAPHRVVRLAVVEVVEPVVTREFGPSGYQYEARGDDRAVHQIDPDGETVSIFHDTGDSSIPPADRPLVARLLGEAPDA